MSIKILDTVVLEIDLPSHDLKKGDVAAVVELYSDDAIEVEFVTVSGHTQALLTLAPKQIRPDGSQDIPAVRQLSAA